ncbi:hypothetical protein GCM10023205_20950 [Yinghuangia aomiensis]|uniref:Uncharacterized protein n=1 Tax=Yinghuangia aomiensis TaxID=676205 RepID=A0ABP9GZV2_9ACTN
MAADKRCPAGVRARRGRRPTGRHDRRPAARHDLLVATIVDLRRGTTANWSHGLAAAYIGFSVAYGHYLVKRADAWVAYRFAGAPKPPKPPKYGTARAKYEWQIALRTVMAAVVAIGLLQCAIWMVGDASRTAALTSTQSRMLWIAGINVVIALTYTLWPKEAPKGGDSTQKERKDLNTDLVKAYVLGKAARRYGTGTGDYGTGTADTNPRTRDRASAEASANSSAAASKKP